MLTKEMRKDLVRTFWQLSVMLLFPMCAFAQDKSSDKTIVQTARTFTIALTPDGEACLTAYLPSLPQGQAVVDCPGGGYAGLAMDHEGHDWASFFNERGIAYFVLKYRMPNGDRSIPIADATNAMRLVRDSAESWRINPRNVGMMGFSAGGHLASTMSTHAEWAERPDFTILFYPVISMNEHETHAGSCHNFLGEEGVHNEQLIKEFSNYNAVQSHHTPPAIILTANDDELVNPVTNSIAYYTAMRWAGNSCTLHVYPTGGHGFGFSPSFKHHEQMLNDLSNWLGSIKAPNPHAVRVACIGNSITDGSGIDMADSKGYPAALQEILGNDYDVHNFGYSSRCMLQKGDFPYMAEQKWRDAQAFMKSSPNTGDSCPDIVIIKLGSNDTKPQNWQYKAEFESDLQSMIDTLRPLSPVLDKKGRSTKKMRRASSPRIFLCTPIEALVVRWGINDKTISEEVIPAIRRVAELNGLPIIDLHSEFNAHEAGMMQPDGIHPTAEGARRMAEIIASHISR